MPKAWKCQFIVESESFLTLRDRWSLAVALTAVARPSEVTMDI
jgi:hypothetical protein